MEVARIERRNVLEDSRMHRFQYRHELHARMHEAVQHSIDKDKHQGSLFEQVVRRDFLLSCLSQSCRQKEYT